MNNTGFVELKTADNPEPYAMNVFTFDTRDKTTNGKNQHLYSSFASKRYLNDGRDVLSKTKGVAQILVACGAHDEPKRRFLKSMGLTVASEWYVGSIV